MRADEKTGGLGTRKQAALHSLPVSVLVLHSPGRHVETMSSKGLRNAEQEYKVRSKQGIYQRRGRVLGGNAKSRGRSPGKSITIFVSLS